jgi:hypothetical protein
MANRRTKLQPVGDAHDQSALDLLAEFARVIRDDLAREDFVAALLKPLDARSASEIIRVDA